MKKILILLKKHKKRILFVVLFPFLAVLMSIGFSEAIIEITTRDRIYNQTTHIPYKKVGLLLGTSKYTRRGHRNLYYTYRIRAAADLYNAKKISRILISGDNGSKSYDEPSMMKEDLIAAGIPASVIYLDYAGFRTLDSVVRAKEVFGQSSFTVISQEFHNERAIFLAQQKGIDAIGFNAKTVKIKVGKKVFLRERAARLWSFFDLFFGTTPKFLGKRIYIE